VTQESAIGIGPPTDNATSRGVYAINPLAGTPRLWDELGETVKDLVAELNEETEKECLIVSIHKSEIARIKRCCSM